jgi:hypothetical protein
MGKAESVETLSIDGRQVLVTNPQKLYFSQQVQISKLAISYPLLRLLSMVFAIDPLF